MVRYYKKIAVGKHWQECTKEEYDQLPDDERKIVTDIYSIFSVNKEYDQLADNLRRQEQGLYALKLNNKVYLLGSKQSLRKKTIVRDVDLDFTKCACSTNSTYGLSTTSHELRVLFVQGFNPNYFLVDNINAQLVQLHLRIRAAHVGGGDSICNHNLRLFYVDGTTKDFTSTNNGACMNSGSTEFIIPEQSKPFNKFQYFANEHYNTGYNVGCNAYLTFISAKEKRVVYVQS